MREDVGREEKDKEVDARHSNLWGIRCGVDDGFSKAFMGVDI
jgi:hypothetical protein